MPTMLSESANGLGANSANAQSAGKPSACRLEHQALSCVSSSVLRPALGLGPTLPTTAERCHTGLPKAHRVPPPSQADSIQKHIHAQANTLNAVGMTQLAEPQIQGHPSNRPVRQLEFPSPEPVRLPAIGLQKPGQ